LVLAALREAGVPVEIVPGVTAACAAAAGLGVSLTHRDSAHAVHLVTGHGTDGELPAHDWSALVRSDGTLAVYMSVRTVSRLASALIRAGTPGSTPTAAMENASRSSERYILSTLAELPAAVTAAGLSGPTMVLIGTAIAHAAGLHLPSRSDPNFHPSDPRHPSKQTHAVPVWPQDSPVRAQ
jgi:siroheme synthase